jgi:hypothetical protein
MFRPYELAAGTRPRVTDATDETFKTDWANVTRNFPHELERNNCTRTNRAPDVNRPTMNVRSLPGSRHRQLPQQQQQQQQHRLNHKRYVLGPRLNLVHWTVQRQTHLLPLLFVCEWFRRLRSLNAMHLSLDAQRRVADAGLQRDAGIDPP